MRFLQAGVLVACFADYVSPTFAAFSSSGIADVSHLSHHHPYLVRKARRKADVRLTHDVYYYRRMAAPVPEASSTSSADPFVASSSAFSSSNTTTASSFNSTVDTACIKALSAMNGQASNPSGMAVCYNMLSWDNSTGAFQADLKLYKICDGSGDWAMVQQQGISIGVTYSNATAAYASNNTISKRGNIMLSWPHVLTTERQGNLMGRATAPKIMSDLHFVGEVNNSTMGHAHDESTMKAAIMPHIVLSGTTQNGTQLNTTLSTKDASFLYGAFSNDQTAAPPPPSKAQVTPFVLPGTTLGIFPVGLIVTGSWTLLFILAVGFGTLGRNEHRKSYRRRVKHQLGNK